MPDTAEAAKLLREERDLLVRQLTAIRAILDGRTPNERAGLGSSRRAQAPQRIPVDWELALLRQINAEEGLDVADDELLDHARTRGYRVAILAAYATGQAIALGYEVTVGELGDRVLIGDRAAPAAGASGCGLAVPQHDIMTSGIEQPVDLVDRTAGRR